MGRRKSKKAKPKRVVKRPLETVFNCPFCNHHESVTVKLKRIDAIATLLCVVCKREFRSQITNLSAAIDVYYEWLDFCEKETNKTDGEDQFTDGVRVTGTGLMASGLGDDDNDDDDYEKNNESENETTNKHTNEYDEKEKEKEKEKDKEKENNFLIESDSLDEKSSKSVSDSDESSDYRSSRRKKKRKKSEKRSERRHRSHRSSKKKKKRSKKRSKKEKRRRHKKN
ncbi:transcription elongation factor 1 [Anaeramoeba flamelloides]|uniref:Transcription elongation factor 1 homolog n=1 Tax=Anaeramoeba flamelloides TaxID=1746091 RepID=A0ABQ8X2T7_9EUKA|nr:transcription elongation factor 1 [Anaeramoeba flamelloides]